MTPLFLLRVRSGEQSYVEHWQHGRFGTRVHRVPYWLVRIRQRLG